MPWRCLRGHWGRLTLTVIALALGVSGICAIDLENRAVLAAFTEVMGSVSGRADLQVTAGNGMPFAKSVAAAAAVPGVALIVPVVSATAFVADGSGEALTVHGFDLVDTAAARIYGVADGQRIKDLRVLLPGSVVLPRAFASRRGVREGDRLTLETAQGRMRFTVRGLVDLQGLAGLYGEDLVVMDLYAAQVAFGRPGYINRVDVVVKPGYDAAPVAQSIRARLPQGLRVETTAHRAADLERILRSFHVLLIGIETLGLIAAFIVAFSGLSTLFERRAFQIGLMRAAGVREAVVRHELLKEGMMLGAMGLALGIPLGIVRAHLGLPMIAAAAALQLNRILPQAELFIHAPSLLLAAGVGLGTALLAAVLPAWRAARLEPAETLRARDTELPAVRARAWCVGRGVVLFAIGASIAMQAATRSAAWGLVATALVAIATALAARPLVELTGRRLPAAFRRLVGPAGAIAVASLTRAPRRSALTVAVLGVGLGSVLWMRVVAGSFERSAADGFASAYRADVVVSSARMGSAYLPAPLDDRIVARLAAVPGVLSAAGERQVEWDNAGSPLFIIAADPARITDPSFGRWPLLGSGSPDVWEGVGRGEAVIVSSGLALRRGLQVGDVLTLETPSGPVHLPVAGVSSYIASPRDTVFISRETYRRLWQDNEVNLVFLLAAPGAEVRAIRSAIAQQLGPGYGLRSMSGTELAAYFGDQVRRAFAALDIFAGVVLFVVLVSMADTLAAAVLERTRELGVLRALGVRRRHLRRMVIGECLALGMLGIVLAIASGLGLGMLWVRATFPYLLGWLFALRIPYERVGVTALLALVSCLAAGLVPASWAAGLEPAEALRCE